MSTLARRVAQLSQLRADRAERVVVDGENILLVRDGDTVRAYAADCPHAGGPLEQGAVCNGRIICPWHKATFAVARITRSSGEQSAPVAMGTPPGPSADAAPSAS